jgi:hypothetical protein
LGEVGALAQGSNLAKGSGAGGGRKPSGDGSFGGGGGGGGDQYEGSFAAFSPRFNDSAYGLPVLPGALSQLTRPNRSKTGNNQPVGSNGGFDQTDGTDKPVMSGDNYKKRGKAKIDSMSNLENQIWLHGRHATNMRCIHLIKLDLLNLAPSHSSLFVGS